MDKRWVGSDKEGGNMLAVINKGKVVKIGTEVYSDDQRVWKVVDFEDNHLILQELYRIDRNINTRRVRVKTLFKKYLIKA